MERTPGDADAVRRVLGTVMALAAPSIAYLVRSNALESIATLANVQRMIPKPVTNTDTLTLSSAAYHAGHAMDTMNGRWGIAGFMTLSSIVFAIGAVLIAWPWMRPKPT